jgi:hypothetical protein
MYTNYIRERRRKKKQNQITKNKVYKNIAQSVKWRATGWTARIRFPAATRDIFLLHSVQTSFGAHPASYSMDTGGSIRRGKTAGV